MWTKIWSLKRFWNSFYFRKLLHLRGKCTKIYRNSLAGNQEIETLPSYTRKRNGKWPCVVSDLFVSSLEERSLFFKAAGNFIMLMNDIKNSISMKWEVCQPKLDTRRVQNTRAWLSATGPSLTFLRFLPTGILLENCGAALTLISHLV